MVSVAKQVTTTTTSTKPIPHPSRPRNLQNVLLIWLDPTIDASDQDCRHKLEQLHIVIDDIYIPSPNQMNASIS